MKQERRQETNEDSGSCEGGDLADGEEGEDLGCILNTEPTKLPGES